MPNPPLDWRKIEAALTRLIHDMGYSVDQHSDTGDKIAPFMLSPQADGDDLNLTELAKDLAKELER